MIFFLLIPTALLLKRKTSTKVNKLYLMLLAIYLKISFAKCLHFYFKNNENFRFLLHTRKNSKSLNVLNQERNFKCNAFLLYQLYLSISFCLFTLFLMIPLKLVKKGRKSLCSFVCTAWIKCGWEDFKTFFRRFTRDH